MEWQQFFDIYAANFRQLTNRDGLPEWKRFADQIKSADILRDALKPLAESYALGKNSGLGSKAPTLYQVRKAFTDQCELVRKQNNRNSAQSYCNSCGGTGKLLVFSPIVGDVERKFWPPNPAETEFAQIRGVEIVRCPECSGIKYPDYLRARILAFSVRDCDRDALYAKLKDPPDWAQLVK